MCIVQPAQFIKLCNLHAAISKDPDTGQPFTNTTVVELVIHRGTSYGRGIVFLSNDSPEVQCLKKRMKEISGDFNFSGFVVSVDTLIHVLSSVSNTTAQLTIKIRKRRDLLGLQKTNIIKGSNSTRQRHKGFV